MTEGERERVGSAMAPGEQRGRAALDAAPTTEGGEGQGERV